MRLSVASPFADIRETPDAQALRGKLETQLVFGESFVVEEEGSEWFRGSCAHDGYKGFIEAKHLRPFSAPTHIVTAHTTWIYRDASIKSPPLACLSFGSRLSLNEAGEKFSRLASGGWVFNKHISPLGSLAPDYIATALTFLETPYFWGGRSGFGIDCSGLVQVVLARAGFNIPRDTEDQEMFLNRYRIDESEKKRGDIVYFKGHVGLMLDQQNLLHATAHVMKVCIEPLADVCQRSPLTSVISPALFDESLTHPVAS